MENQHVLPPARSTRHAAAKSSAHRSNPPQGRLRTRDRHRQLPDQWIANEAIGHFASSLADRLRSDPSAARKLSASCVIGQTDFHASSHHDPSVSPVFRLSHRPSQNHGSRSCSAPLTAFSTSDQTIALRRHKAGREFSCKRAVSPKSITRKVSQRLVMSRDQAPAKRLSSKSCRRDSIAVRSTHRTRRRESHRTLNHIVVTLCVQTRLLPVVGVHSFIDQIEIFIV